MRIETRRFSGLEQRVERQALISGVERSFEAEALGFREFESELAKK